MTNITIERAKLEKWLATMDEATTYTSGFSSSPSITKECKDVCDEIKQALATQQEPVAWGNFKEDGTLVGLSQHPEDQKNWTNRKPLYTTPPAASVQPEPCCGKYDTCIQACTPRGRFLAKREAQDESIYNGCYIDLDDDQEPDSCVLDDGNPDDCDYVKIFGQSAREKCGHWKPVKFMRQLTPHQTMNNIISMAAKAYITPTVEFTPMTNEALKRFADLVRANERDGMVVDAAKQGWAMKNEEPFEDCVKEIAEARARKENTNQG